MFVCYESGARASEILGIKIKDAEFDQFGAVLHIRGKTGKRMIRLVESVSDLRLWLSMHPDGKNPDAWLWPGRKQSGGPLSRVTFEWLLAKLGERAGLSKHIHPHLLRHSRATHLANVLTEPQMREFFGWTKASYMPEIYVHLSGRDVDATLLKHYGIKIETPAEDPLELKTCPWCQAVNSPSARFCQRCNAPLDPASAEKAAEKQRRRMEFTEWFIERMLQEAPSAAENALREKREELAELASGDA
ncbi:MAG: site-specific integrase [Candidatus Hodarchaeaceae archaeon]|nr:site-specific integrase [Candidatus Hodarchaeaceae archaeon]